MIQHLDIFFWFLLTLAMADTLSDLKGILFDINGVFQVDNRPLDRAVETIEKIQAKLPCRFVTNTTTQWKERPEKFCLIKLMGMAVARSWLSR